MISLMNSIFHLILFKLVNICFLFLNDSFIPQNISNDNSILINHFNLKVNNLILEHKENTMFSSFSREQLFVNKQTTELTNTIKLTYFNNKNTKTV